MLMWELARETDGSLVLMLQISPSTQPTERASTQQSLSRLISLILMETEHPPDVERLIIWAPSAESHELTEVVANYTAG